MFIFCIYFRFLVYCALARSHALSLTHTLFFLFFWRRRPHRTPGYRTLNVQRRQTLVIITRQSVSFSYAATPTATATEAETETQTELLLLGTAASRSGRINNAKRQRLNLRLCRRRSWPKLRASRHLGRRRRQRRRRRRHWLLISWPREKSRSAGTAAFGDNAAMWPINRNQVQIAIAESKNTFCDKINEWKRSRRWLRLRLRQRQRRWRLARFVRTVRTHEPNRTEWTNVRTNEHEGTNATSALLDGSSLWQSSVLTVSWLITHYIICDLKCGSAWGVLVMPKELWAPTCI